MRWLRSQIAVAAVVVLLGLVGVGAFARSAQPPPDATPGSVGFGRALLGEIDPAVAVPGRGPTPIRHRKRRPI
jgi:hypothetical protein